MATSKANEAVATELPQKKSKKILFLILGTCVVLAMVGSGFFYWKTQMLDKVAVAKPIDPIFYALEPFTANLQVGSKARFVHAAMTLKLGDATAQPQLAQYLPEVRSRVLALLSNRDGAALESTEDRDLLAAQILGALSQPYGSNLAPPKIKSVMFTTFMLQ
jgi:flagellar FliL protein